MDSKLEWVEKAALENLRGHLTSTDIISNQANTTLTILIAALGGSFTSAVAIHTEPMKWAAGVVTVYLFALCMLLVTKCMMIKDTPALTNTPRNLLRDDIALDDLVRGELNNFQERIDQVRRRNELTSDWLNGVRIAAIFTPLLFALVAFAAALYRGGG